MIVLMVLYFLFILRITIFRSGFLQHDFFSGTLVLVPFTNYRAFIVNRDMAKFVYNFGGNIAWFLPFGFWARRYTKLSVFSTALIGFTFSFIIEVCQFVFGVGTTETDDVILNTLAFALGWFIHFLCEKAFEKKVKQSKEQC